MADVVSPEVRSRMMASIRSKNTKPEVAIRRGLHALGFRYRIHDKRLPGKPDLVFPKYRAVIFVHGCFWHGHDCHLFKKPKTRPGFWLPKIDSNRARDASSYEKLRSAGWRIGEVWECATKGPERLDFANLLDRVAGWLRDGPAFLSIRGIQRGAT